MKPFRFGRQHLKHFLWKRGWDVRGLKPLNGIDVLLWSLLPELDVNCVIDVGAHDGEFGMLIRAVGFAGRIVSFEPTRRALLNLGRRTQNDPDWHVHGLALGSSAGVANINVANESTFSSFRPSSPLGRSIFQSELTTAAVEQVQVRRLDEVFAEVVQGIDDPRVYLKIDTQGWDLEVFSGATGCLDRIVAAQSEMSLRSIYEGTPTLENAMTAFSSAGFGVVGMFMLGPSEIDRLLNEFDCVMVRRPDVQARPRNGSVAATQPMRNRE